MENGILYEDASYSVAGIFYDMFYMGIIVGAVGLIFGVLVTLFFKDRGMFVRSNSTWSFIAKLNYLYIPVCFAALFGLVGAVYSFQYKVDNLVDFSEESFMRSGEKFLPAIDSLSHQFNTFSELEDEIYEAVREDSATDFYYLNKLVSLVVYHGIKMLTNELGYPDTVAGVQQMAEENNFSNPSEDLLRRLPEAANSYYWVFFRSAYWNAFWTVFPYFLIPVGEYGLFLLVVRVNRTNGRKTDLEKDTPGYVD